MAMRPKQWAKNVLVAAPAAAAGMRPTPDVLIDLALAFAIFAATSSATYLINDVRDREIDAAHHTKRHRPVAAGVVPWRLALAVGVALHVAAVTFAFRVAPGLAVVILVYVAATTAYSAGLKRLPLVELFIVASGFVLRPLAGAAAVGVPVSQWFLIVISAGALHLVATKRFAELRDTAETKVRRAVLARYTADLLAEVRFASLAVALTGYLLWAFERSGDVAAGPWLQLSAIPFALAMFRYAAAVHEGAGEAPEDVLLADRQLLLYGLVWCAFFIGGVYAAG